MDKSGTQLNQILGYDITHYSKVLSRDKECATLQSISTEELFHPNIIKVAFPVSLNQSCHAGLSTTGENGCTLESMVAYHYPPAFKTRQASQGISQVAGEKFP